MRESVTIFGAWHEVKRMESSRINRSRHLRPRHSCSTLSFRSIVRRAGAWLAVLIATVGTVCATDVKVDMEGIASTLKTRCYSCHDSESRSGGMDLQKLTDAVAEERTADWVKVEQAIISGKMPPPDETSLSDRERQAFHSWFESTFVFPGGRQHPGPSMARRLTREELQNTLEDILHVDIRVTVTNSRLHVIPDTIIEKFFSAGVVGPSGFSNDAETLARESTDIQTYARCFSLVISLLDANRDARSYLFGTDKLPLELSDDQTIAVIDSFATAAWRRKPTGDEVTRLVDVFHSIAEESGPYEGVKASFLATLLSPSFLFRIEDTDTADPEIPSNRIVAVPSAELAVRLSYFLWSAPPDEELWTLAANDQIREDTVLRQQVRRMLSDPRRIALAENLGGEWFDYRKLRQKSAVNKRSDRMAGFYRTQYEEGLLFFDSIIRYRQSLLRLVDADWAWLNRHQRGIYRLQTESKSFDEIDPLPAINLHYRNTDRHIHSQNYEYRHAALEPMKLTDADRGGFVTLGPTLSVTSTANRTSPIRRGVWVLERILGKHFEVPDNVPDLEETKKRAEAEKKDLSDTELLKLHSSQSGCAACHQYIDPIGFGLEAFDQLGISRTITDLSPTGEKLQWSPKETPARYADHSWSLREPLIPGEETRVFFQYTKGRHRLNIRNVRLTNGDLTIEDKHFGFTGEAKRDNVWFFSVPADAPPDDWKLIAQIEGDGGTDSHGTITIAGPEDQQPGYKLPDGSTFRSPAELKQLLLSSYRAEIIDNAIKRVLGYALGRETLPLDRPAIRQIRESIRAGDDRLIDLIEAVALSFPFRHKALP